MMTDIKKIVRNAMMMTILLIVIVLAFFAYNQYQTYRERVEWNRIACSADIHDYENFMKRFPDGKFYNMAHTYFLDLKKQESDWHEIEHLNNVSLFREYINNNPSGKYIRQARRLLDSLLWSMAINDNNISGYQQYMNELPEGAHYSQAKARAEFLERNTLSDTEKDMCRRTLSSFFNAITNRNETNLMMHVSANVNIQGKTSGRNAILAFMNNLYANDVYSLPWNVFDINIEKNSDTLGNTMFITHFSADVHIGREDSTKIRYAVYDFVTVINAHAKIVKLNFKRSAAY